MSLKPTKPTNDLLHHTCTTTAHYKHAAINTHRHTHAAQQWTGPLKKKQRTGWQEDWLAAGKLSLLFSLVYATMIHSFFKMFKT